MFRILSLGSKGLFYNFADCGDKSGSNGDITLAWCASKSGIKTFFEKDKFIRPDEEMGKLSRLLGPIQWGGTEQNTAVEEIQASYDLGVTSIDTAPIYGQGFSEDIVGHAIKDLPRDKVQILTKFCMRWDLAKGTLVFNSKDGSGKDIGIYKYAGKESIIQECEDSLKRLGNDYIDL